MMKFFALCGFVIFFACSASKPGTDPDSEPPPPQPPEPEPVETPVPLYYALEKGSQEVMNVYVKIDGQDDLYARFCVRHVVTPTKNCDLWRILDSYFARLEEGAMVNTGQRILASGENEFVWYSARPEVTDATGGYHGNERIDLSPGCGVTFFADGVAVDHSQAIALTPCQTFHYEQNSTMHQTGTGGLNGSATYVPVPDLPVECTHFKKTTFGEGGYTTSNRLVWADNNAQVKNCIYALFCVDNGLTTQAQNESGQTAQLTKDGSNKLSSTGKRIVYTNPETGLKIECRGLEVELPQHSIKTYIWDNQNYHKFYSTATFAPALPAEGDTWTTASSISFSY